MQGTEVNQLVESIARWVARRSQKESIFLMPVPQHFVYSEPLLDHIYDETGIPKETISAWVDSEHDKARKE